MLQSTVLQNGLRVVTESIPGARSVSIGLLVDAGPQDDPEGREGLAHLVEHGFFLGTSDRDAKALSRMIDEAGGRMGAFTSRDYTCFYAHVMDAYGPFAWELIGDIVLNSTFPEEPLMRERDIVLQELGICFDSAPSRINDILKRSIWPSHPLGRSIAGNIESVQRLDREDVIYFVGEHYTPGRMVVAAAGAVDHDAAVAQAQDVFWSLCGGGSEPRCTTQSEFADSVMIEHHSSAHAYFALAMPSLPYQSNERFAVHMLNSLIGGGISSRFYTSLRETRGLLYDVHSSYDAYQAGGAIVVEGVSMPEHIEEIVETLVNEIETIATNGIDEEELWRTKMQLLGQTQLASDLVHTRMSRLLTQEHYFGRMLEEKETLEGINSVSVEAIQAEAERLLVDNRFGLAVITPEKSPFTIDSLTERLKQASQVL